MQLINAQRFSINIEEIQSMLMEPFGFTLLIKGPAGAGKTTLALEILKSHSEGIFVSTRITPISLYTQFPWVEDYIKPENILDASQTYIPDIQKMDQHIKSLLYYKDIPGFLKVLYDKTTNINNPLIVIDSWTAIINMNMEYLKGNTIENEKAEFMFAEFMRQMNAKVIMVSESYSKNQKKIDYIVDGILSLENNIESGRMTRKVKIEKLRGKEIKNAIREFTLFNGRFRSIDIITEEMRKKFCSTFIPRNDKGIRGLFSGIKMFDNLLNGTFSNENSVGTSILIEEKGPVADCNLNMFLHPLIINHLIRNMLCFILTPINFSSKSYLNSISEFISLESLESYKKNIRILNFDEDNEIFTEEDIFDDKHKSLENSFKRLQNGSSLFSIAKSNSDEGHNPILYIIYLDALEYKFNSVNFMDILGNFFNYIKSWGHIAIFISKPDLVSTKTIPNMIDKHIIFQEENGSIKIHSKKPRTKYYGVNFFKNENSKQESPKYNIELMKIV
ncbi:MAG: RAD55 family ATPase [Promethearchaeota archaeon]